MMNVPDGEKRTANDHTYLTDKLTYKMHKMEQNAESNYTHGNCDLDIAHCQDKKKKIPHWPKSRCACYTNGFGYHGNLWQSQDGVSRSEREGERGGVEESERDGVTKRMDRVKETGHTNIKS